MMTHNRFICVDHYIYVIGVLPIQGIHLCIDSRLFIYLQPLLSVTMIEKVTLNPGDTGIHSAPGMMLVSSHTCLTTSSAFPVHDLPLFGLFPFPTMSCLCSRCSVSVHVLRNACFLNFYSVLHSGKIK